MIVHEQTKDSEFVQALYNEYPYPKPFIEQEEIPCLGDNSIREKIRERIEKIFKRDREWFIERHGIRELIQMPQKLRILDAGCGTGRNTVFFAKLFPDSEIHAYDITDASLFLLQKNLEICGIQNVTVEKKDLFAGDIPENQFDHIFSLGVIHHTPDPKVTLKNLGIGLKKGGSATLFVYNRWGRTNEILGNRLTLLLSHNDPKLKKEIIEKLGLDRKKVSLRSSLWEMTQKKNSGWIEQCLPPLIYCALKRFYLRLKNPNKKIPNEKPSSFNSNWDAFAHPCVHNLDVDSIFEMAHFGGLELRELWFDGSRNEPTSLLKKTLQQHGLNTAIDTSRFSFQDILRICECLIRPRKMYFRVTKNL